MEISLFNGLSAFPITPCDDNGVVDTDALSILVSRLAVAGVSSAGVLGSTGTYAYLNETQRQRAAQAAIDAGRGSLPVIIGVGALSTREAVSLAQHAATQGADGLLIAPISYTPLTEEEIYQHYCAIAAAADIPICIYNNPGTTHVHFSLDLLARLSHLPNVQAVKMPLPADGDYVGALQTLKAALPDDIIIGYSGDWGCVDGLIAGANSWFSVLAGTLPGLGAHIMAAISESDIEGAKQCDAELTPLWDLFKRFGSLRVVYALCNHMGLTQAQPPRPILPLPEFARKQAITALEHLVPER